MKTPAQIVIYLDPETKALKAEIGGPNGARRKINLPENNWENIIEAELISLDLWLRDQEKRKEELETQAAKDLLDAEKRFQKSLHQKNWDRTVMNHNRGGKDGRAFANKFIGFRDERDQQSVEELFS